MRVIMDELDNVFMSYEKILRRLKLIGIKTKGEKEISHKAVSIMLKKHPTCIWRSEKIKSRRYFILYEAYLWLIHVYFQSEKSRIDADIDFFECRIKAYEELLKIENNENWWNEDMNIEQMKEYFNRTESSARKAIKKMCDSGLDNYKYLIGDKVVVSKNGIEWICKNIFKQKYLELLEKYKMELTEEYIKQGYIYDEFFGKN